MKTIIELAQFIRFQLGQLTAQDKHHEFEYLARHLARLRICENILPATGPVGAGGDQGRDFESYRTYLETSPIAASTFLGLAKDKKLVFACSLQIKIETKIKSDLETICKASHPIHAVYYFCETNIPVGKRHKLQQWCHDTYNVELEIFDGQALAEQLTSLDVFWLAQQFLDVPSEFYPRSEKLEEPYNSYKLRWLEQAHSPRSYADFFQIKYCLRKATFQKTERPDLSSWLKLMEIFISVENNEELSRRAILRVSKIIDGFTLVFDHII